MQQLSYEIRFLTPAFLGDAAQNGRWRTPPFKALLRQWWRVVYARDMGYAVQPDRMLREEGALFGAAADGEGHKSQIRLRLGHWQEGKLKKWGIDPATIHPEVPKPIGAHLYLGYGPLSFNKGTFLGKKIQGEFVQRLAIEADATCELRIAIPRDQVRRVEESIILIEKFGSIGGRSRSGWGSIGLGQTSNLPLAEIDIPTRPWQQTLELDWAHAVGTDESGPLIWVTRPHDDWSSVMQTLAAIKIGLRTQFPFTTGRNAPAPEDRHWLSYPVTNHNVREWGPLRLPNMLRFKIRTVGDGKLVGLVFHMPCSPPRSFGSKTSKLIEVWQSIHAYLDNEQSELSRSLK